MGLDKRLVVDAKLCTGCRLCELACSFHHSGVFQPSNSRIRVKLFSKKGFSTPTVCLQCESCYSIDACKDNAIRKKLETGAIEIDLSKCTRCNACLAACPHGGIAFSVSSNTVVACDLCGGDPECVKYCFPKALDLRGVEAVSK